LVGVFACSYEYLVRASNAAGSSDSSPVSVTTAESVPADVLPPSVSPVPGRSDHLLITWSAPRQPNGLVRYYVLQRNQSTPWNVQTTTGETPTVDYDGESSSSNSSGSSRSEQWRSQDL